jgi:HAE1 family hydrophobic/amphiphilic exporter-1
MLRLKDKNTKVSPSWYDKNVIKWLDKLDKFYENSLRWSLNHKKTVVLSAIGIFVGSILLATVIGTEFMPSTDDGYLTVSVELQSGTNVNQSIIIARQIDSIFYANFPDEIDLMATSTGSDESGGIAAMFTTSGSNIINFDVGFVDAD